jgi:arylsulfatase A
MLRARDGSRSGGMTLALLLASFFSSFVALAGFAKPNLLVILCDDLGYGDVRALNPEGKIATPKMDRLAAGGMVFSDAHGTSAVCTPTRYSLLTGRYNWRTRLQNGVLGGVSPHLIEDGRMTLASLLQQHGYQTVCIGKWHLGMDWTLLSEKPMPMVGVENADQAKNVDFGKPISNSPTKFGFEHYFGVSASLDMIPYTFIKDDRVTQLPSEEMSFPMMSGRAPGHTRRGPGAPGFEAEDVLPTLTRQATDYIHHCASDAKAGKPFFLYLPLTAPHTPIAPTKEWLGRSGLNPYADFVMQTDWTIGEVLKTLDESGLSSNTLVICTSDNGCSPQAKFDELAAKGHHPSYIFRGMKADIFDGGHRIPFIARWPGHVRPGTKSDQLICLMDLMGTMADLLGAKLPPNAGEDSVSILPALTGTAKGPLREALVHHSINGSFGIRQANWKLELCADSGGWSSPKPGSKEAKALPSTQLYDLANDIGEQDNLAAQHPEVVERLTRLLEKYIADGRSTPGPRQTNDVPITIRKAKQQP